jgi:mono/diheme cytochrome c family protein
MAISQTNLSYSIMSHVRKAAIILATLLVAGTSVSAAEIGDAKRGLAYAKKVCSECHGVNATDEQSPDFMAPTFREVANTKGITERALYVWLQSGNHESMPNFMIEPSDLDDVIAYIMSMRATQAPQ